MAKTFGSPKVSKYPYPSRFGSHASMVIKTVGDKVILEDENGQYVTETRKLDTGLSDINRNREPEQRTVEVTELVAISQPDEDTNDHSGTEQTS